MRAQPVDRVREQVTAAVRQHRRVNELGLPAVAVQRDHQVARDPRGDIRAVVTLDDVQAQVNTRRAARGRQQVTLIHVQDARVDPDARVPAREVRAL